MHIYRNILLLLACFFLSSPALAVETSQVPVESIIPTTKILGGTESSPGDWPWMVALLRSNTPDMYQAQYCSGVLIDNAWVLTAAHCVINKTAEEIEVAVGVFDLKNFSGGRISVKNIYQHPQYSTTTFKNDIALLELSQPSSQPTITLFSGESQENAPPDMLGRMLTAIGWGMAEDGTSDWYYPSRLRQVDLPVVANSTCNNIYTSPVIPLSASQLCAGYYEGKDVCNGDSGGPVVSRIDDEWVHIGLVSFGAPCQTYKGWYGVYTRTSGFIDFIQAYVPDAHFTSKEVQPPPVIRPPSIIYPLLLNGSP